MIELRVLGGTELRGAGGEELRSVLHQPKRLALLAYLAAAVPRGFHRRDVLVSVFWPELDQSAARNALGQAVHFLRQELGAGALLNRGRGELGVCPAELRCDAVEFELALDAGRTAEALELYGGDLLAGFHLSGAPEFDRWLERERVRLRDRAVVGAWRLADAAREAGDAPGAVLRGRAAMALAPFDECALRRLLLLLEEEGDRAGALQAYDDFARRLGEELDAKPAAETEALAERIRAGRPAPPRGGPAPPASIAVLPFLDLSPEPEEYLADGITEELISALATLEGLQVTSRTSSFAFKGRSSPVREVAAELGVATLLEGSIRHGAERIRVTAQLIDARTDAHLWAGTYDLDLRDFLAVQTEVAEQIARALRVELSPPERERIGARPPGSPRAFHLYLRGRHFWNQGSPATWGQAVEMFRLAIEEDPRYALAWAGLADAHVQLPVFHVNPPLARAEALARARVAALRALELNDELGEAHAALATVRWYGWDWGGAERSFRRALLLNPGYATAHHRYGLCLAFLGRFGEAERQLRRAQELDPLSLAIAVDRGVVDLRARRWERAIAQFRKVLEVEPAFYPALHYLGEAYNYNGQRELSVGFFVSRGLLSPGEAAELVAALGRGDTASYYRRWVEVLERVGGSPTMLATAWARAGEPERGWEFLARALQERDPVLTDAVRVHPGLDPFRADSRFAELLRAMGVEDPPGGPTPA